MVRTRSTPHLRRRIDRGQKNGSSGRSSSSSKRAHFLFNCYLICFTLCHRSVIKPCSALIQVLPQKSHGKACYHDSCTVLGRGMSKHLVWDLIANQGPPASSVLLWQSKGLSTEEGNSITKISSKLESCTMKPMPSSILRNMHQSRVLPEIWQLYFCPSLSLGQTIGSLFPRSSESHGIDVKIFWKESDLENLDTISERFIDLCDDELRQTDSGRVLQLAQSERIREQRLEICRDISDGMRVFTSFCALYRSSGSDASFSLRLVCSFGNAATKCPQWHIDHVPCRYIQALHGPGCMFIENGEKAVIWDRMNALYDDEDCMDLSIQDRNSLLIDTDLAVIGQAEEGEAIILLGNEWWEKDAEFHPAVHKSPQGQLTPWQARILLTMDVLEEHP